jgi:large repetitive protein
MDGTTVLGTAMLDSYGNASFVVSNLSLGSHSITAIYSGNPNYNSKSSAGTIPTLNGTTIQTPNGPALILGNGAHLTVDPNTGNLVVSWT